MPFDNPLSFCLLAAAAVTLDRLIGDPPSWPHPVRYIGSFLTFIEPRSRTVIQNPFLAGTASALLAMFLVLCCVSLLYLLPGRLPELVTVYFAYSGLALGQLVREGQNVLTMLRSGDMAAARTGVGHLVSRDVSKSGTQDLSRALAESLAENMNDAFVAPFFWFAIGGPLGLWLYKTVSTMDSMWGYPHEPWTRFGTFSARLDDMMAFIPARLTMLFMIMAQGLMRLSCKRPVKIFESWPGLRTIQSEARKMKSPNAGWPMAAAAWLCGASMGGPAIYAGQRVEKPFLGPPGLSWTPDSLQSLLDLMSVTGYVSAVCLSAAGLLRWL